MSCRCSEPREATDPRRTGSCIVCGKVIGSGVLSTDETVRAFFDRLASTFPGKPPESFHAFRAQCEQRERSGRSEFGVSYLSRSNILEANEEWSDGANYILFDVLQNRRKTGHDEDLDLALTAAFHAFKAHEASCRLAAKRRGSP